MSASPLRALVAQSLRPSKKARGVLDDVDLELAVFEEASAIGAEAIAGCGVGLDHLAGERVLAACLFRSTPKEWAEHRISCAITDRRTALSGWSNISGPGTVSDRRFSVLHRDVMRTEQKSGLLGSHVSLFTMQGKNDLTFSQLNVSLAAFFDSMLRYVPPEQRWEPPTPFVRAEAPLESLWAPDPAAAAMLEAASRRGDETGKDFMARTLLAHRSALGGPGMANGSWMSPMAARDFGLTLVRIFGTPLAHGQPAPGFEQLDFRIDPQRDPLSAAAATFTVGASVLFGHGRAAADVIARGLRSKAPVTELRVVFGDRPSHAAYHLQARGAALERVDAMMAHRIHRILAGASYDVVGRRIERGWDVDYRALFA